MKKSGLYLNPRCQFEKVQRSIIKAKKWNQNPKIACSLKDKYQQSKKTRIWLTKPAFANQQSKTLPSNICTSQSSQISRLIAWGGVHFRGKPKSVPRCGANEPRSLQSTGFPCISSHTTIQKITDVPDYLLLVLVAGLWYRVGGKGECWGSDSFEWSYKLIWSARFSSFNLPRGRRKIQIVAQSP